MNLGFRIIGLLLAVGISSQLSQASSLTALNSNNREFLTQRVRLLCGYSDAVYDYIVKTLGEKQAKVNMSMTARQDETSRRLIMYADNSWLVTFEYFSAKETQEDITCIMAKGDEASAHDAIGIHVDKWPEEWLSN